MTELLISRPEFGTIQRPVKLMTRWPGSNLTDYELAFRLAGPVVLDAYAAQLVANNDDFVSTIGREVEVSGVLQHSWTEADVHRFRSAVWRSAHRYVVENIALVDRGREMTEISRMLKVDP